MKFCLSAGDANGKPLLSQSSRRSRLCLTRPTGFWKMLEVYKNGVAGAEQHQKSAITCKIHLRRGTPVLIKAVRLLKKSLTF